VQFSNERLTTLPGSHPGWLRPGRESGGLPTESLEGLRSPDGAQRNPGRTQYVARAPDYAALHPGYELAAA